MSDLDDRLKRAIDRGQKSKDVKGQEAGQKKATAEELRTRHSELRLTLSDHIESCLRKLCDHFPGFEFSSVVNEDGWGARITRDDINLNPGSRGNLYSRFEMLVRPFSDAHILELATKGTVRNREALTRNNYRFLNEAQADDLQSIIDGLVVEFAEHFSAEG